MLAPHLIGVRSQQTRQEHWHAEGAVISVLEVSSQPLLSIWLRGKDGWGQQGGAVVGRTAKLLLLIKWGKESRLLSREGDGEGI